MPEVMFGGKIEALRELKVLLFCQQMAAVYDSTRSLSKIGKSVDGGPLLRGHMKEIKLTQGKVALVDDEDYEWLNQWKWHYRTNGMKYNGYAGRAVYNSRHQQRIILMHRLIADTPDELECDHIDGNGLNNVSNNLRNCTGDQNKENKRIYKNNSSGYKGVHWHNQAHKWRAGIRVNGKFIHLGLFSTAESACRAYNEAATIYFGKFARLNKL